MAKRDQDHLRSPPCPHGMRPSRARIRLPAKLEQRRQPAPLLSLSSICAASRWLLAASIELKSSYSKTLFVCAEWKRHNSGAACSASSTNDPMQLCRHYSTERSEL